jgi:fructosamine-3-kinase
LNVEAAIAGVVGRAPRRLAALAGGCVGEVYRAEFDGGEPLVAKIDRGNSGKLDIEGAMLTYLAPHLPVPAVVHAAPELLLMEWVEGGSSFPAAAERHAAELLAALHTVTAPAFGFERDTLIGGLHQPNPTADSWLPFFAENRMVFMAEAAHDHGRLDAATVDRVRALAADLGEFLAEPDAPSLLHGDVWSGNVLAAGGRITGFLDPAIYFGHPEVELAFITMFSTFGDPFFDAYRTLRPLDAGFMSERRHLYNLYPYLVHVRLFGGSYVRSVEAILARFGY